MPHQPIQVFIPMTGIGARFQQAGYRTIKPLILVQGKPIIHYVADLFPQQSPIHFICNQTHLEETALRDTLSAPTHRIIPATPQKLGPVAALKQAYEHIDDKQPIIVCYCDFYQQWDYQDFLQYVHDTDCDGAVVCYQGFHPHLRHAHNVYASCQTDTQQRLIAIREKHSFTPNTQDCPQSSGLYYFKSGALLKRYCDKLLTEGPTVQGEYYVSLAFAHMVEDQCDVRVYNKVPHFCQWGTPADLAEYLYWQQLMTAPRNNTSICATAQKIIPMAGAGKRFVEKGYAQPKPCILVDDHPMVAQANRDLPAAQHTFLITQQSHRDHINKAAMDKSIPNSRFIALNKLSSGQATSALAAKPYLDPELDLIIGACDNGMRYDGDALAQRMKESDAIIFTFRNNPTVSPKPEHYSWVQVGDDQATAKAVSLKQAISEQPIHDHALVGAFWFKKAQYFIEATEKLQAKGSPPLGEWYIDEVMNVCIQSGYQVNVFEIDYYIGWGTPDDLQTYTYWRTFFDRLS
jgi:NDP-sugar pyrophosphorylase family protein